MADAPLRNRESQSDHFARLTEACVEGGFRDAHETEVVSLWAHGEITRLREALVEYAQHNSWRCEHAPHYYYAASVDRDPALGCPCGLDRTLVDLGLRETA